MSEQLLQAVLRADFMSFVAKVFATVNPGKSFEPNWHIGLIGAALGEAVEGRQRRLILNMPPRMLKSVIASVAWPAWLLGHDPKRRIIVASYSQQLAVKHAVDCRQVMQAPWYRQIFPGTVLSREQNEKHKFGTTAFGFRLGTSVGGTLTGEGGDVLILDDPMNPRQAHSPLQRDGVNEWVRHTFLSRLDDRAKGAVVVVMQRLHDDDVTGALLREQGVLWRQIALPAQAAQEEEIVVGPLRVTRKAESLLHEARLDHAALARTRIELGPAAFEAQYQQQPLPERGHVFQAEWFRRYRQLPEGEGCFHSWDTANGAGERCDYSVGTVWRWDAQGNLYLADMWRGRVNYPELRRAVQALWRRWPAEAVLIEDKGSGQSLLQELRAEGLLPLVPVQPRQDKVTRAAAASGLVEGGKLWLPEREGAPAWLAGLEAECLGFPNALHDDQVDSVSQALLWARGRLHVSAGIRSL